MSGLSSLAPNWLIMHPPFLPSVTPPFLALDLTQCIVTFLLSLLSSAATMIMFSLANVCIWGSTFGALNCHLLWLIEWCCSSINKLLNISKWKALNNQEANSFWLGKVLVRASLVTLLSFSPIQWLQLFLLTANSPWHSCCQCSQAKCQDQLRYNSDYIFLYN